MIGFAVRRLGWALVTALIASIVAFVLFWAIPDVDPSFWLGGAQHGTAETRAIATRSTALTTRCRSNTCA